MIRRLLDTLTILAAIAALTYGAQALALVFTVIRKG